ncbi:hypothetical protein BE20_24230 [Sorangium cellulosum]|uniref:Uncharacterized protein n=1 Tax=Sorangium cellulosum TaxID=56 RepID=A0A150RDZ8_SORCE|nr:hypothetical protein BE18_53305 [Sorangium cellulosum]KYF87957.1 hypothetical protein BE20_24230 [Sorangium cellulosum]
MPSKKKDSNWTTWEDMPIEEFRARAEKAKALAAEFGERLDSLFPGLVTLTKEQRQTAPRLRDGEHAMLNKVLDVVDMKPALFESLADQDEGMDPNRLETALLRDRIEKHLLFSKLAESLAPIGGELGDSTLYTAVKFREALYAAYRIAKTHAQTDRKVMDVLAPVIDFMRRNVVAAAAAKKSRKPAPAPSAIAVADDA